MKVRKLTTALLAVLLGMPAAEAQSGVYLKNRLEGGKSAVKEAAVAKRRSTGRWHRLLVFANPPGRAEVDQLQERGITVVQFVPERGLMASVPDGASLEGLNLEWSGSLVAEQKLSTALAISEGGVQNVLVEFYPDVGRADAESIIRDQGLEVRANPDLLTWQFLVSGPAAGLAELAQWDEVAYLFPASRELAEGRPVEACAGAISTTGRVPQIANQVGEGWDGAGRGAADLTYTFGSLTSRLTPEQSRSEVIRAMKEWAKYAKVRFTAGSSPTAPRNITVLFATGEHGDGYAFDGSGKTLAHTFFPAPPNPEPIAGDLHLDDDEAWQVGANIDLFSVALHELGHSLGLTHSDSPSAVMYPYYRRVSALAADDITSVLKLYAAADSDPAPAPLGLNITEPASASISTSAAQVTVGGSTSGGSGTGQVTWTNNRGGSGTASGFRPWTIAAVPLAVGENVVTITATDGVQARVSQQLRITRQQQQQTPAAISVRILTPASGGSYVSSEAAVTVTGVTEGPVVRILWTSSRGTGGSALGSDRWTIESVPLENGSNVLTISAIDVQGNRAVATIQVAYTAPTSGNDTVAPSLQFTSPAATTLMVSTPTISIAGTAADNVAVTEVNWLSSSGRSGTAIGTSNWRIPDLPLSVGVNVIMIRAYDAAGNMSWRSLVITRQ